ncbi:deoxyribose-phosphate aldolase [Cohnella sp. CFH 77786]|nr:deoxyribose-phosphate aldolase [Cohnella sp. CFH 77786]
MAPFVDYSLIRADAVAADIRKLCEEALRQGCHGVCVCGGWVRLAREMLSGTKVKVCAAVGFPLGTSATRSKAFEASAALDDGASEIDMVLPIGRLIEGDLGAVERDIAAVVQAVQGGALVKVTLETSMLPDERKRDGCRIAEASGADYVQTSTGYGPGGAKLEDIRLLRSAVSPAMGVKAAGGIRDRLAAEALLAAGANRIGTSTGSVFIT